ncbi:MAG TPA: aldo/keto reductase [Steroidobacteraceae bacterium]|jgi:diketogulonate reductase-like aldo/keto reductase|nr:aldo/keto reductase [Steroidobacteraceae bacterium]
MTAPAQQLKFPGRIGLGTWKMGASRADRAGEIAAVSHALAIGYRLLDTAEMYAEGGAERVIGSALKDFGAARRQELFIVSKVLPNHASRAGTIRACEASIARMRCEYLDLYLLHWRGSDPFRETLRGLDGLRERGLIRHFGVSNLDLDDLVEWLEAEQALGLTSGIQCNQLHYCLEARAIEFAQLAWQRQRGIQTMAYSPLGQGALTDHPVLRQIAAERGLSAAQIALAWSIRHPDVVAIPKSVQPRRIEENFAAAQIALTAAELALLDRAFPPPRSQRPLPTT